MNRTAHSSKLPQDREIFYQLFESSPDGIVVVDAKGRIIQINTQAENLFGYTREELIGNSVETLIPERFLSRHVDHREHYLTEPRTRPMGANRDLYARRKDGSEFPVDIMLSPLKTENGKQVLAVVRDVTDRKQVEAEARENRELFFRLFEFAPDAIVVVDTNGRITRANAVTETLFGYTREELIGEPVEILIPERFSTAHEGHRAGYLLEPRTRPMGVGLELYAKRKDGSEFPVGIMLSPVEMEQDRFILGVVRDITERRTAEVQKREVQRRETLLKEIHHRVKNNLQVISSLLYLQSTTIADPHTRDILTESQNRAKSIALIHEKLYQSENFEKLDFAEYVRDLLSNLLHSYGIQQENLAIQTHIQNIYLGIDTAIPCGLIINELISNAIRHAFPSGENGRIQIELQFDTDHVYTLKVRDNGIGLPEDIDWRKSKSLGLKLVSDLTRQLGGKLEVSRKNGTEFRITFAEVQYKERR